MKIFISQPMGDLTESEIRETRNAAIRKASELYKDEDIEVLDSFFDYDENAKPLWFLGKSLQVLSQADLCYFVKGWCKQRGCMIEYLACKEYGIETYCEEALH